ncbi:hypothetical protein Kim5_CH01024 [Rhizobium sp. Kim5]|nr:hypothetical protein Kim5_CH01024 [Rhizobium sp. Kim5]
MGPACTSRKAPPRQGLIDFYVNVNFDFPGCRAIVYPTWRFALAQLHKWTSWRISNACRPEVCSGSGTTTCIKTKG